MRRRKWFGALVALAVALLLTAAFLLWPRADRVAREKYLRIHLGMTFAELVAILGPPGDFRSAPDGSLIEREWIPQGGINGSLDERGASVVLWETDEGEIAVVVRDSKVTAAQFAVVARGPQTSFENFLWRARRLWRRWLR